MGRGRSWYQVLQVDPQAEPEIIEAAYRRLAKKYHPDVATSRDAGERMKEINAAYAVLCDPVQRGLRSGSPRADGQRSAEGGCRTGRRGGSRSARGSCS